MCEKEFGIESLSSKEPDKHGKSYKYRETDLTMDDIQSPEYYSAQKKRYNR